MMTASGGDKPLMRGRSWLGYFGPHIHLATSPSRLDKELVIKAVKGRTFTPSVEAARAGTRKGS